MAGLYAGWGTGGDLQDDAAQGLVVCGDVKVAVFHCGSRRVEAELGCGGEGEELKMSCARDGG